jgi:hypothetical protein
LKRTETPPQKHKSPNFQSLGWARPLIAHERKFRATAETCPAHPSRNWVQQPCDLSIHGALRGSLCAKNH